MLFRPLILLLNSVVFPAFLLWPAFRGRIIVRLEMVVSYKWAHSFLDVSVFNNNESVMEVYK